MTDGPAARAADDRWSTATVAATRAGVRVRTLSGQAEFRLAGALLDRVWNRRPQDPPEMPVPTMVALDHAGSYLSGAWAGEEMVGASVGFLGRRPAGWTVHSHITGVVPGHRGAGAALKWHQRAWALDRSIDAVTWTFDPLIARNAFFNLERLGAEFEHYLVDFYGPMRDGLNRGQPTDRVAALWRLTGDRVRAAAAAVTAESAPAPARTDAEALIALGAAVLLRVGPGGGPEIGPVSTTVAGTSRSDRPGADGLIGIPADMEDLRQRDPRTALAWRLAVRRVLRPVLDSDRLAVEGFLRSGWYLVRGAGAGAGAGPVPAHRVPTVAPTWRTP